MAEKSNSPKPFEGKILYKNTYVSKNMLMPSAMWNSMMGSKGVYYIKGGDYRLESNGSLNQWQLYINDDNKVYTKISSSSSIYFNEAEIPSNEINEFKTSKNIVEILGYQCDEIILECSNGEQKFYFNSELAIETALFKKHKFANWYDYLKDAHAVPLKKIINTPHFTVESIATEVIPMKLDDALFMLPEDIDVKKNPY